MAYYSLGRITDAQTAVQSALQLSGSFPQAEDAKSFLELAPLSSTPAKATSAEAKAKEVLKSHPDDVPALMVAAVCSQQRGDEVSARQGYERVLTLYPDFASACKYLAMVCMDLGEHQKAFEMATRARAALPEDPEVAKILGIELFRKAASLEDYRNSLRLLDEAARKGNADASVMYYLGMAHYQLSKEPKDQLRERKESKDALQRALALNVQTEFAKDARRVLAELQ